jgi:hypothetical protein
MKTTEIDVPIQTIQRRVARAKNGQVVFTDNNQLKEFDHLT